MWSTTKIQRQADGTPIVPDLPLLKERQRTCAVCGGPVKRVGFADVQRGNLVRHYRCKGECREGGALIGQESPRGTGPIFTGRTPALREADL